MAAGKHWTEAEGRRASVLLHLFKPSTLDALLSDLRLSRAGPSKGSSIDAALHIMELDGSLMNCLKRVATRGDLVNFLMIVLTESQLDNYKLSKIEQDDLLTAVMHYVMDGFTGGVSVFEDSVYAAQQQLEDADKTGRYAFFDKEEMIPVKKFLTQLDAASLGVLECKLWVQQSSSAKAARVKGIADRLDIDACAAVSVSRFLNALQDGQINDLRKIMFEGDGVCSRASCQREVLQWVYEDKEGRAKIQRDNKSQSKKRAAPQANGQAGAAATSKKPKSAESEG